MTKAECLLVVVTDEIAELDVNANMAYNRGDRAEELLCDQRREALENLLRKASEMFKKQKK